MRLRDVAIIIALGLGLMLVLVYFFVENPYIGLIGYILQLIGSIMFLFSAVVRAKQKHDDKTGDSSSFTE